MQFDGGGGGQDEEAAASSSAPSLAPNESRSAPDSPTDLIFRHAPSGLALCHRDGTVLEVNVAFATLLGVQESTLAGQKLKDLFGVVRELTDAHSSEVTCRRSDGRVMHGLLSVVRVTHCDESLLVVQLLDHTRQRELERRLKFEAYHDRMTGLPTRALFLERVADALREDRGTSLIAVGLDRMKFINESLGHGVGDQVLVQIAERLAAWTLENETIGRLTGDEFAILSTDWSDGRLLALQTSLEHEFQIEGRTFQMSASFGIRTLDGLDSPELLLGDAVLAMRRGKALGGRRVVKFDSGLREKAAREAELARHLREAIEHDEIDVDLQPIHNSFDGSLAGFEALARWRRSPVGVVPPIEFIPIAESRGLIGNLGLSILRKSLAQLAEWRESDERARSLFLSLNVSPVQARDSSHLDLLIAALDSSAVPPQNVKVELTESVFLDLTEEARHRIISLHDRGVHLMLDDFGTGYSSLNHLRELPFEGLKVDRSFVVQADQSERGRVLVESIAALARALSMKSVAEGVETDAQRQMLTRAGYDYLQGYLFGRPMPCASIQISDLLDSSDRNSGEHRLHGDVRGDESAVHPVAKTG